MPNPPLISIVIPSYNAARWLPETVASVLAQTLAAWELVIVNDGSSDATLAVATALAAKDARIRVLDQPNGGLCAARNQGWQATTAQSAQVIFLDADDLWETDTLAVLSAELAAHPEAVAAYGLARYIDAEGNFFQAGELETYHRERWGVRDGRLERWSQAEPTTFGVFALADRITSVGCVLMRRSSLEKVGAFAPELAIWEDWDLWFRLTMVGPMQFLDHPVFRYRRHTTNLSADSGLIARGYHLARQRFAQIVPAGSEFAALAQLGARLYHQHLSQRCTREGLRRLRLGQWMEGAKELYRALRARAQFIFHS